MEDVIPPKPDDDDLPGSCDWGRCDDEPVSWRYSKTIRIWLPVCPRHELGPHPK